MTEKEKSRKSEIISSGLVCVWGGEGLTFVREAGLGHRGEPNDICEQDCDVGVHPCHRPAQSAKSIPLEVLQGLLQGDRSVHGGGPLSHGVLLRLLRDELPGNHLRETERLRIAGQCHSIEKDLTQMAQKEGKGERERRGRFTFGNME